MVMVGCYYSDDVVSDLYLRNITGSSGALLDLPVPCMAPPHSTVRVVPGEKKERRRKNQRPAIDRQNIVTNWDATKKQKLYCCVRFPG